MKYLLCILIAGLFVAGCGLRSTGVRIGVPFKLSEKGLICKTWEGSANLGGARASEGGAIANVFDFTISAENPRKGDIIAALADAMDRGRRVKMKYEQHFKFGPCAGETSYFLVDVTPLE